MECIESKTIVIGTPTTSRSELFDIYIKTGVKINNRSLKYRPTSIIYDDLISKEFNMKKDNNRKELHEAGQKRREKNFAMQRVARNISNEAKAKQLELFYQNTVLLLSGYSIYQLQKGV